MHPLSTPEAALTVLYPRQPPSVDALVDSAIVCPSGDHDGLL
jgi:hypothetical protein